MLVTTLALALVPAPQSLDRSTVPPLQDTGPLGAPALPAPVAATGADGSRPESGGGLHLGDLDGDGLPEVWSQPARGAGHLYWNRGEGRFLEVTEALGLAGADGSGLVRWVPGGEGGEDLCLVDAAGRLTYWVLDAQGLCVERGAELGLPRHCTASDLCVRDLDGDGAADLLFEQATGSTVLLRRGAGWVDLGAVLPPALPSSPAPAAAAPTTGAATPPSLQAPSVPPVLPPSGALPRCTPNIEDQASVLACLLASSVPTLGMLYPLSSEWFVDDATGFVGIGTIAPARTLDVAGTVRSTSGGFEFPDGSVQLSAQAVGPQGPPGADGDDGISGGSASQTPRHDGAAWVGSDLLRNDGLQVLVGPSPVTGSLLAVRADPSGPSTAVTGESNGSGPGGAGVRGIAVADDGTGVEGFALSFTGAGVGVRGDAFSGTGVEGAGMLGVVGVGSEVVPGPGQTVVGVLGSSDYDEGVGVRGEATGASGIAVHALGDLVVTGAKAFAQPHPTDPSLELRFACLEGPESGTYCRGSAQLHAGVCRVELPEVFRLASSDSGLTAQVTARGPGRLWVESVDAHSLVVRGDVDVPFDWFVHGVRAGFEDFQVLRPNVSFPRSGLDGREPVGARPGAARDPRALERRAALRARLGARGVLPGERR